MSEDPGQVSRAYEGQIRQFWNVGFFRVIENLILHLVNVRVLMVPVIKKIAFPGVSPVSFNIEHHFMSAFSSHDRAKVFVFEGRGHVETGRHASAGDQIAFSYK